MHEPAVIRAAAKDDSATIARIYNHYIAHTVVTFEEEVISAAEIGRRMDDVLSASLPYLVAEQNGVVIGYAYAAKWRLRSAYRFSVETTVYLDADHQGKGFGTRLYEALLEELRARGFHAAMGGIALPNAGSVALHEKLGFRQVAHFAEVGFKFGKWIDTGYWQCVF